MGDWVSYPYKSKQFLLFQDYKTGSGALIQSVLLFFAREKRTERGVDHSYPPIGRDTNSCTPDTNLFIYTYFDQHY